MNCLVTYASKYGSTKKYAQWIAEELDCDLRDAGEVDDSTLSRYDVLIHGGGLYAGALSGIRLITDHYGSIADKTIILFLGCCLEQSGQHRFFAMVYGPPQAADGFRKRGIPARLLHKLLSNARHWKALAPPS